MREENLRDRAMVFEMQRKKFIEAFATIGEVDEEIGYIKDAMEEDALPKYKFAMVVYLNAMINGSRKIYRLVRSVCGEKLFAKLLSAGLKKV